ncbi:MAG: hypothetical protein MUF72_21240 [Elainella sp. Prado103]|jgi:hypothetical protein|nr:hypothetical protein [Elainella sp. Prado103]
MGFYARVVLPRLLDWSLSDPNWAKYRPALLADVQGEVLEIGHQFQQVAIEQFTPENMPDLIAHLYRGVATKPES